ncbi:MAG: transposase [Leptospiraceae bacterium]|nr:transposase [Leptospiraceae bacterium]
MIEHARRYVPKTAEFVILADGFYDSKIIFETCKKVNGIYVTVADSARVYAPKKKLYDKGIANKKNSTKLIIKKGEEKYTRQHMRYASSESGNKKDIYKVYSEILEFPRLGKIQIVYSWKNIPKRKKNSESYKILLCNDTKIDKRKIVELYALRWQVEIYFRELKSELGLCDYAGKNFEAQERFIDVCLLSFLFLEWSRLKLTKEEKSKKIKGEINRMRSRGIINLLKKNYWTKFKDEFGHRLKNSELAFI